MDEFRARLAAAYDAWHASRGRTPDRFFELYADEIELRSILEVSVFGDVPGLPFVGKQAALAYYTAIAEAWEMLDGSTEAIIAEGDRIVWIGRVAWRNLRTLRKVEGPKIDVWTLRDGRAVCYLEVFDTYGTARALGLIDQPDADGTPT